MDKDKRDYYSKYFKRERVRISLNLSKEKDKEIIDAIDKEDPDNKQAAIKSLILKGSSTLPTAGDKLK